MTTIDATAAGPGASLPRTGGVASEIRRRGIARILKPALAMAPFTIYTFLGLGIPTIAVVDLAFRSEQGALTLSNMRLISHGTYRLGFENSLLLAAITSVVPGILGVFLAYAIETSRSGLLRRLVATASGVLANFGGINLTFMFIATIGSTGILTAWLKVVGLNPWDHGFDLYSFYGVALVYLYFQIPLMVLVITPALGGLRPSWREAAENLGASSLGYWRTVGIPVLLPSVLGGMLLLFGSAFAAYATADTLTAGTVTLAPIQIGAVLNGNVIAGEEHVGYAIGFGMLIVLSITMVLYALVREKGLEMASLISSMATEEVLDLSAPQTGPRRRGIANLRIWRLIVLVLAGGYFLIPIYAGLRFSFEDDAGRFSLYAVRAIPSQTGFSAAFWLSIRLAAVTTVLTMALMVPTATYVHLKLPKLRRVLDFVTILPIVIPPIVLILGVLHAAPLWLRSSPYLLSLVYVVLALPFVYRSLDAGLTAIDLKTLVEASRSLGGAWVGTLWRVILPNIRAAMLSATVLTIALVLGEFTMAGLDLWTTIPVWIYQFQQQDAHIATAVSMLSLIGTWLLLLMIVSLDRSQTRRARRRTGTL